MEDYFNEEFVITNNHLEHIRFAEVMHKLKVKGSSFGEVRTRKALQMMGLKVDKVYFGTSRCYIAVFGFKYI
jgi:hypothetical protein